MNNAQLIFVNQFANIDKLNYEESIDLLFYLFFLSTIAGTKEREKQAESIRKYAVKIVRKRFGKTKQEITKDIMCSRQYKRLEVECK